MAPLHWGIIGTGDIAEKFVLGLNSDLTTTEHKVVAISCSDIDRSRNFANKHKIENYYGTYRELANDATVEVAYIAVPNTQRYDICLHLLDHGKHIVCETPFCMNQWQTEKVLEYAKFQNRLAISGIWSRFFPSYRYLRELISMKMSDDIREVYIKHGFKYDTNPRVMRKEMGCGIVLELGAFAIQFALLCFNEFPKMIKASGKVNSDGIDLYLEADLIFSDRRFARIICSGLETFDNQAVIISKKGAICLPSYCCPLSLIEPNCTIQTWWIPETEQNSNSQNSCNFLGLRYEADEVFNCIRAKQITSGALTPNDMINIARIQDEIRRQIGVRYDCDKQPK